MISGRRRPSDRSSTSRTALGAAGLTAIVLFATIGQLSHHGDVTWGGFAADTLPFLGCWLAAAWATGRFVPTWLAGAAGGVAIRAVVLSHYRQGELAFLAVALVFLGAVGLVVWLAASRVLH